jgi:uridine kinase
MRPILVAIVGGSGSGKSWLAEKLAFGRKVARFSLDDFYRDRSHLPLERRGATNFDHPAAIEWSLVEETLRDCVGGKETRIPQYDFTSHSRLREKRLLKPMPIVLVDGLWLLRRPALRRLFDLRIFIDCPARTRLKRRLARDQASRGRTPASIRRQFRKNVEPMHLLYVAPQARWADVVLQANWGGREIRRLVRRLKEVERRTRSARCS